MKNDIRLGLIEALITMFMISFLSSICHPNDATQSKQHSSTRSEEVPVLNDGWKKLNLREKIGQVVCFQYSQETIDKAGGIDAFLKKYPVGSIFMASWNLNQLTSKDSLEQLYHTKVSALSKATKVPLLFVEDFESGIGSSIDKYTEMPAEMGLGATQSKNFATAYGNIVSAEARAIGMNWLLHPVADLNLNPLNHLTNVRSLGDDVNRSIELLPLQVKAMQSNGVAATAKHFPGDGTDFINQHFSTSTMSLSVDEWKEQHGKVFQQLIDDDVMCIMAGHINFPAYQKEMLDGEYLPATLSKELLTNLLKGEMGFNGVIVSDALNMAGMAGYYENELESEIKSFEAGTDILLWPDLAIMDSLEVRIKRGEISEERLNDAVQRVWNMKSKLGLLEKDYVSIKELSEQELNNFKKVAEAMSLASITEISNKHDLVPFTFDRTSKKSVLAVIVAENEDEIEKFQPFKEAIENYGLYCELQNNLSYFEKGSELDKIQKQYDYICFLFYANPGNPWGSLDLRGPEALSMWSANKLPLNKVVSIGFGDPYKNLIYMPKIWARYNAYNADKNSQKAMAEVLLGAFPAKGKSPVNISAANVK